MNVKLEYAEKALDALIASGADENSIEVLQAKKLIQDTQNAVNDAVAKNGNRDFDFMEFLGIGEGLSDEENCKQMIDKRAWTLIAAWTMLLNSVNKSLDERLQEHFKEREQD